MNYKKYIYLIKSDLFRYFGKVTWYIFLRLLILHPGYKISFWMRTCKYLHGRGIIFTPLYGAARLLYFYISTKHGAEIPFRTEIGPGLYIGHYNGIVINHKCVIGMNCNLSQGVTIGRTFRGKNKGVPIIGDNVFIGPGAVVIGKIKVGDNVAVGANSVVPIDVPDHAVIAGVPGKVISLKGSDGYVRNPIST